MKGKITLLAGALALSSYSWGQCKIDYSNYHKVMDEKFDEYTAYSSMFPISRYIQLYQLWHSTMWQYNNGGWYAGTELYPTDPGDASFVWVLNDPSNPGHHMCRLKALKRSWANISSELASTGKWHTYMSGMLNLKSGFTTNLGYTTDHATGCDWEGFQYGIIEMECKMPSGDPTIADTWPAFWGHGTNTEIDIFDNMDPDQSQHVLSGYIDWGMQPWSTGVAENPWTLVSSACPSTITNQADAVTYYQTHGFPGALGHYPSHVYPAGSLVVAPWWGGGPYSLYKNGSSIAYPSGVGYRANVSSPIVNLSTQFHKYSLSWTPDKLTYYFDGREVYTRKFDPNASEPRCPQNIIANLEMQWLIGDHDSWSTAPSEFDMDIRRITVYKGNSGPSTPPKSSNEYINYTHTGANLRNIYGSVTGEPTSNKYYYLSSGEPRIFYVNPLFTLSSPLIYDFTTDKRPKADINADPYHDIIVYKDMNNNLRYLYHVLANNYSVSSFMSTTLPVSANPGSVKMGGGQVAYVGNDSKIHIVYEWSGTWIKADIGSYSGAGEKVRDNLSTGNDLSTIYYTGVDDKVQCLWRDPSTGLYINEHLEPATGTNKVAPGPGTMCLNASNNEVFYVRKSDKHMCRYYWNTTLGTYVSMEIPFAYTASTNEIPRGDIAWDLKDGVFYVGNDGRLQHFYLASGTWHHEWIDDYWNTIDFTNWSGNANNIFCGKPHTNYKYDCIFYGNKDGKLAKFDYCNCENSITIYTYDGAEIPTIDGTSIAGGDLHRNSEGAQPESYFLPCEHFVLEMSRPNNEGIAAASQIGCNVYPNPSTGVFNLVFEERIEGTIYVYDLQGKLVLRQEISDATATITLDQPAGMYICKVDAGSGSGTIKLSVEK